MSGQDACSAASPRALSPEERRRLRERIDLARRRLIRSEEDAAILRARRAPAPSDKPRHFYQCAAVMYSVGTIDFRCSKRALPESRFCQKHEHGEVRIYGG